MNADIANILNAYITPLPFIERNAGLVKTISYAAPTDDDKTFQKSIPVACNVSHADCVRSNKKLESLVPDSSVKSISYWEDQGVRKGSDDHRDFSFESSLRFVCWLNLKKLGKTDCSYSALAITNILNAIPTRSLNSTPYTRIQVRNDGEIVKDKSIFSKYTYEEDKMQYLMYPFDYFALDFVVKFCIPKSCIIQWENGTEGCEAT